MILWFLLSIECHDHRGKGCLNLKILKAFSIQSYDLVIALKYWMSWSLKARVAWIWRYKKQPLRSYDLFPKCKDCFREENFSQNLVDCFDQDTFLSINHDEEPIHNWKEKCLCHGLFCQIRFPPCAWLWSAAIAAWIINSSAKTAICAQGPLVGP